MEDLNINTERKVGIERNRADEKMGQSFAKAVDESLVEKIDRETRIITPTEIANKTLVDWANYLHQIGQEYGFDYRSFEEIKRKLEEKLKEDTEKARSASEDPNNPPRSFEKDQYRHLKKQKVDDRYVLTSYDPSLIIHGENYNEFHLKRIARHIVPVNYFDLLQNPTYSDLIKRLGFEDSRYYIDYNCTKYLTPEERQLVADLLGQEYKFHLMPRAEDVPFLLKVIHALIAKHERFGKLVSAFKFANFVLYRKIEERAKQKEKGGIYHAYFYKKFGGGKRVAPFFVLYPYPGYEIAQEVADILRRETSGVVSSGIAPQLNDRLNDLVYVANGSGADKYNYIRLQTGHALDEKEFTETIESGGLLDPNNLAYAKGARHIT